MEELALQVRKVDPVEIHDADFTDSGGGEVHRDGRSEPPGPDTEDTGRLEAALALDPDVRNGEVPGVALTFREGEIHLVQSLPGDE